MGDGRALLPRVSPGPPPGGPRGEHESILPAGIAHDPDGAAATMHHHLAATANGIAVAMGGGTLFELSP
jgi:DNA-binding GntR family transcriptional regulator